MNRTMHHLLCLPCLACICATATALDNELPAPPVRYEVELIVFRHIDQSRNTPEIPAEGSLVGESPLTLNPADDAEEPFMNTLQIGGEDPGALTQIVTDGALAAAREREPTVNFYLMDPRAEYPDFVPIDTASLELDSVFRRLEQLDAYQPLVHLGWIQTAKNASEAVAYEIHIRDQDRDDVTGSITLYKERYLHLALDLALDSAIDEYGTGSDFYTKAILEQMRATGRKQHKLTESRRIRQPSSHYFDHPLFGVIARIQKIVVESPSAEESDEPGQNPPRPNPG
jgi:hypothetical protein